MAGSLVTVSGLGGLVGLERILSWYTAHAYWFLATALLFLRIAAYFNLYRYPSRTNKVLMGVNVLAVLVLMFIYWV